MLNKKSQRKAKFWKGNLMHLTRRTKSQGQVTFCASSAATGGALLEGSNIDSDKRKSIWKCNKERGCCRRCSYHHPGLFQGLSAFVSFWPWNGCTFDEFSSRRQWQWQKSDTSATAMLPLVLLKLIRCCKSCYYCQAFALLCVPACASSLVP